MDIFEEVRKLGLPKGSYVVVGGGHLVALGILEWDEDVDLAVSPETFETFKVRGWEQERFGDKPIIKHGIYDVGVRYGEWDLKALLKDAVWIQDIPFVNLDKLRQWKTNKARPKDFEHLKLLDEYLART